MKLLLFIFALLVLSARAADEPRIIVLAFAVSTALIVREVQLARIAIVRAVE